MQSVTIQKKKPNEKTVIITRVNQDHVLTHHKVLFNVNNLYGDTKPADYHETNAKGNTHGWIDLFHENNYQTLTLDETDLRWMKEAQKIGFVQRRFSKLHADELQMTCERHQKEMDQIRLVDPEGAKTGWFIRSEAVSLKEGMHGVGPYTNLQQIIESMCTANPGHTCFQDADTECKLYFMKWVEINKYKEFRIFVVNNKITAISDQHLITINEVWNKKTDDELYEMVNHIISYFSEHIAPKLEYIGTYVMDLALVTDNKYGEDILYFIEPNSFGRDYAAGSSLFHWVYDHDQLHTDYTVEFRYVHEF